MAYSQRVCVGSVVYGQVPFGFPDPGIPQSAAGIPDVVGNRGIVHCTCAPGLCFPVVVKKFRGGVFFMKTGKQNQIRYSSFDRANFLSEGLCRFLCM